MIGLGYHAHDHAAGDPAQRARGPDLVHRLHAVPARDLPGPARGAAQLPDRDRRPDRPADRQRLAARRGHRRRRGDDAGTPRATGRRRGPFVVDADALPQTIDVVAHPRRGHGHRGGRRRPRRRAARRRAVRRAGPVPRRVRPGPRPARRHRRGRPRARRAGRRRRRPAGPDPARGAGRARRRRRRRLLAALRRAALLRRPARRLHGGRRRAWSATCPAGWSGCRSTPRAARPTGWRCRPASSTSAATRRPPTSAPRRCCWPSSRRCTPSTTAPTGCGRSRPASTATPPCWPRRCRAAAWRSSTSSSSTPSASRVPGPRGRGRRRGARARHPPAAGRRRPGRALAPPRSPRRSTVDRRARGLRRRRQADVDGRRPGRPRDALPDGLRRSTAVPHPRGVHDPPQRDRDAALPAAALRPRLRPRPRHDPARLVHDEAQRHHRDGAGLAAGLRRPAPVRAGRGRRRLPRSWSTELEGWLAEVTGYDRVSIQPNAGSQGELAGLLAIRGYHRANGDAERDVCLIPSLGARHQRRLGGDGRDAGRRGRRPATTARSTSTTCAPSATSTPTTSPRSWSPTRRPTAPTRTPSPSCARSCTTTAARCTSTARTSTRCSGHARPGEFGGDVSHLNLHKTFCIPHGGGGPGRRPGRGARAPGAVPALAPDAPRGGEASTGSARSAPRRTARRASCRSRGPTSG